MQKSNKKTTKRRRTTRTRVPLPLTSSYPSNQTVRLVFTETFTISEASAGNGVVRAFRLNNAYDVDAAVGGTSAVGFAQYAAMFNNYRVLHTRVNVAGVAGTPSQVVLMPMPVLTVVPSPAKNTWAVQPYTTSTFALQATGGPPATGGQYMVNLNWDVPLHKVFGIPKKQYEMDSDYAASVGAGPVNTANIWVGGYSMFGATVGSFGLRVTVSMLVRFFNPKLLNP